MPKLTWLDLVKLGGSAAKEAVGGARNLLAEYGLAGEDKTAELEERLGRLQGDKAKENLILKYVEDGSTHNVEYMRKAASIYIARQMPKEAAELTSRADKVEMFYLTRQSAQSLAELVQSTLKTGYHEVVDSMPDGATVWFEQMRDAGKELIGYAEAGLDKRIESEIAAGNIAQAAVLAKYRNDARAPELAKTALGALEEKEDYFGAMTLSAALGDKEMFQTYKSLYDSQQADKTKK